MRTASAAENMAVDFLMLQRYPQQQQPRFRHYGWRSAAFTFGYSQKIAFVRAALPQEQNFDLCRRPTGGGVVDHRDDWTFSLVIPRGHPLEDVRATQSYREVHECLALALQRQNVPAEIKKVPDVPLGAERADSTVSTATLSTSALPGVCFERAELYDVINKSTGEKIAGAAQKRNRHGLLFQGSLWRPALGVVIDEDRFHDDFVENLAGVLGTTSSAVGWPEFNEDEAAALIENYSSPEWLEAR